MLSGGVTVTVGQAAKLLQCSRQTIRRMIARGELSATQRRAGRWQYIDRASLEAVLRRKAAVRPVRRRRDR